MLAAEAHPAVAELLAERFDRCVGWSNKKGVDAVRVALPASSSSFPSSRDVRSKHRPQKPH